MAESEAARSLRREARAAGVAHFHRLCDQCLAPGAHQALFAALALFANTRSLEVLCDVLVDVFDTPDKRSLLMPEVRRLVPNRMQPAFNDMLRVRFAKRQEQLQSEAALVLPNGEEELGRRRNWTINNKRRRSRTASVGAWFKGGRRNRSESTEAVEKRAMSLGSRAGLNDAFEAPEAAAHVVKVVRDKQGLGLNIRGGAEFQLGLFVSKVDADGAAKRAGLLVGDQILAINDMPCDTLTHEAAVDCLKRSKKLKLVVRSLGRVPDQLTKREAFTWVSPLKPDEAAVGPTNPAADDLQELRRVNFEVSESGLGISIRGGKELGLGIYISSVDRGSAADDVGLVPGDQICDANGIDFDGVSHDEAVHILKTNPHLFLTIKSGGAIPQHRYTVDSLDWTDSSLTTSSIRGERRRERSIRSATSTSGSGTDVPASTTGMASLRLDDAQDLGGSSGTAPALQLEGSGWTISETDVSDDVVAPLRNVRGRAAFTPKVDEEADALEHRASLSFLDSIVASAEHWAQDEANDEIVDICVQKDGKPLGLTITTVAVAETPTGEGPTVRVKRIADKGAVAADGRLVEGDYITAVEDVDLRVATHQEAVDAILAALENGSETITFSVWRPVLPEAGDDTYF